MKYSSIADNSKEVKKGGIFVAIKGEQVDGNNFIPDAIKKGAVLIVSEKPPKKGWLTKVKYKQVKDARESLALLASEFYGQPSKKLTVIGVTGSDGKTTTSHMIYNILKEADKKVGLISTISAKVGSKEIDTGFHVTNPEPIQLNELLSKMVKAKLKFVVLETTSHGIAQRRVSAIGFDIAVLTNITHEHIDYHKTFANYRNTKLDLFLAAKVSILNKDDKSYSYFHKAIHGKKITYSTSKEADISPNDLRLKKLMGLRIEKAGEYNLQNALAAASVARALKIPWDAIRSGLSEMSLPKGRLEAVSNKKGINIYIDFAHTPNALKNVLSLLKKSTGGKLIAVFGCAGERDTKKRPMMAEISTSIADISVFTAEDSRTEKIEDIFEDMIMGIKDKDANYHKISERGEAIAFAINKLARGGDTVVVCGKAHERSMAYNGVEYPWSDFRAVELALRGKVLEVKK